MLGFLQKQKLIKKNKKTLDLIGLTCQTCNMDHDTEITTKRQTTINYEVQYLINQVLKNEIKENNIFLIKAKTKNIIWQEQNGWNGTKMF